MKLTNPYGGRSKRMIPITRKASGGSASAKSHPVGLGDVKDAHLTGKGTPYSAAHVPSTKRR